MAVKKKIDKKELISGDRYVIAFYDLAGEQMLYHFDNIKQILEFMGLPFTVENYNHIYGRICYHLIHDEQPRVDFLTGKRMNLYVYDCITPDDI